MLTCDFDSCSRIKIFNQIPNAIIIVSCVFKLKIYPVFWRGQTKKKKKCNKIIKFTVLIKANGEIKCIEPELRNALIQVNKLLVIKVEKKMSKKKERKIWVIVIIICEIDHMRVPKECVVTNKNADSLISDIFINHLKLKHMRICVCVD